MRILQDATKEIKFSDKKTFWDKYFHSWWWDCWLYNLYEYSWVYSIRWYITHWYRKDHWVKTNLSIGYHDKVGLMEDALFSMVENYISRDEEDALSDVYIDDEVRDKIIAIVHFYRIKKPLMEKAHDAMLHELYGNSRWNFIPCKDKLGFNELIITDNELYSKEEREQMRKESTLLKIKIHNDTQKHLMMCVEIRNYLWT